MTTVSFVLSVLLATSLHVFVTFAADCGGLDHDACDETDGCVWVGSENGNCAAEDCDAGVYNWDMEYVGQSTQFKLFDPCNSNFIKVKMEDLTEYSPTTGKTNSKETSFANTDWDHSGGVSGTFNGVEVFQNTFNATLSQQAGGGAAGFVLRTYLFSETVNATYTSGALKFSVNITNWVYQAGENYLVLCIGIMTNNGGPVTNGRDTYYLDRFKIRNEETAECSDGSMLNVTVDKGGNGQNHLDLCYTFDACDGDIFYDPIVSGEPSAAVTQYRVTNYLSLLMSVLLACVAFVTGYN
jgi:hypothetical protein